MTTSGQGLAGPSVAAPAAVDEALAAAAGAACDALPADTGWSGQTIDGDAPTAPGRGAQAVAADLPGLGRLVLAVAAPLARDVQVGPPPAEDLLDGLRPAFTAAAAAFGVPEAALEGYGVVDPAALSPGAGEEAHGLLLLDGDSHKASLAFIAPAAVPSASAVADHEFAPLPAPAGPSGRAGATAGRISVAGGPIELLHEVEMGVTVELGRTRMLVRDILDLSPGSVIELDRAAGAPIDVLVNGTLIARGEVVVIDEEFGIRITEVVGYEDSGASPASPRAVGR
ncbi:MAG TPA: flagellar motor switch protein FliN [Acidimicrobiia bacterium]|jgi:flagellar motor switch protein FliN/FliY|nr:flagellar motor switch protein FliN [Acidimicrobiia bacterium]